MSAEAQAVWITAAIDALEGIRAEEIEAVSAEIRRSITRPSQIVPEIAKLVAERRKRGGPVPDSKSGWVERGNAYLRKIGREDVRWFEENGQLKIEHF